MAELWLGFSTLVRCGGIVAWFSHFSKMWRSCGLVLALYQDVVELWLGFNTLVRCGGVVAWI